jgi:hypothetical protein
MATYISLIKFTQQGITNIKDAAARLDSRKESLKALGTELKAFYLTMGRYDVVADALAGVLDPAPGWYCDFRTKTETFVVRSGRVFRYRRRDNAGRERAVMFARSIGIPESQIDWPD